MPVETRSLRRRSIVLPWAKPIKGYRLTGGEPVPGDAMGGRFELGVGRGDSAVRVMGKKPAKLERAVMALAVDVARRRRCQISAGSRHTRPRFILPRLWGATPARARTQRYVPSRADAQDGEDVALANAASEPVVLQFPAGWFILRDILYIKRSDFWVGLGGSWRLVGCPRIARSSCRPCRPARPRANSLKPRKPAARHRHPLPALTSCTFRTRMIRVIDGCNGAKQFELSWVRRESCGKCPSEPERKECLRRPNFPPPVSPVGTFFFLRLIAGRNAAERGLLPPYCPNHRVPARRPISGHFSSLPAPLSLTQLNHGRFWLS